MLSGLLNLSFPLLGLCQLIGTLEVTQKFQSQHLSK